VKRTVTLEIAGTKFRLVADTEENHLRHLASIVNQRLDQLEGKTPRAAGTTQLLALVALGLVDDLLTAEQRLKQVTEMTRSAVANAIDRIDRTIAVEAVETVSPDDDERDES
jgi:cell division protein ZapA (FtsZ GTPase activity inhibitor)